MAMTWQPHEDVAGGSQTTVEIACETLGDKTRIALTQRGFPSAERRDEFGRAWRDVLALLRHAVEMSEDRGWSNRA